MALAMVTTLPPGPSKIVWSSLIADEAGRIDYRRCKALAALILAFSGGGVLVALSLGWAPFGPARMEILSLSALGLVSPLTGGYLLELRKQKHLEAETANTQVVGEIRTGLRPGRRAEDSTQLPTDAERDA
jgi:hypothetical protein